MMALALLVAMTFPQMKGGAPAGLPTARLAVTMEHELDIAAVIQALRVASDGRFAGLWVEDSGGPAPDVIHATFANLDDYEPAVRRALGVTAAGVPYVLHRVNYTEQELEDFRSAFVSLALSGNDLTQGFGASIDVINNVVEVLVSSPPTGRLAEQIASLPTTAVRVTYGEYRPL